MGLGVYEFWGGRRGGGVNALMSAYFGAVSLMWGVAHLSCSLKFLSYGSLAPAVALLDAQN
jgi:hypothetical protein